MENISTVKIDAKDVTVDIPTDTMSIKEVVESLQKEMDIPGMDMEMGQPQRGQSLGWSDLRQELLQ
jgi:hypothetical protein